MLRLSLRRTAALCSRLPLQSFRSASYERFASRGHFFDVNLQGLQLTAASVRVTVSIVVSAAPTRAYEFESTGSVTLSGRDAVTPEGQVDCVRRAMQRATRGAVDQIVRGAQ